MRQATAWRVCLGLILVLLPGAGWGYEDGDIQIWSTQTIQGTVADGWKIRIGDEFRLGDDASELYTDYVDMGVVHSVAGWLDLGLTYRSYHQRSGGVWSFQKRPLLDVVLKGSFLGLSISNRSRAEWHVAGEGDDVWLYRDKVTATLPAEWSGFGVRPFLSWEGFFETEESEWVRHRFYAGAGRSLYGPISLKLFYLLQRSRKGGDWLDYNVLGLGWTIRF